MEVAGAAGLVRAKRALELRPTYGAVAIIGTLTLTRSAMRGPTRRRSDAAAASELLGDRPPE
jgi:hypothetical protein